MGLESSLKLLTVAVGALVVLGGGGWAFPAFTAAAAELDSVLLEKNRQLEEVHRQLQATQQNLTETEGQSRTLKQELGKIRRDVNQLNLGIRSSQITIEKLNLEAQSLQQRLEGIRKTTALKRSALTRLIKKLQEKDRETLVMTLLGNATLSESLSEVRGLSAINNKISQGIHELRELNDQLNDVLNQTTVKKTSVEEENRTLKARRITVQEKEAERTNLLTQTKNQEKLYQRQITELEQQQLAIADEVEAIERQLRQQIDISGLPTAVHGLLAWPAQGRLAQGWGATKFARRGGYRGRWHNGIDISGPIGTIVASAEQGVVLATGNQDLYCHRGAYGKYVVVKHLNNLITLYGHLSQIVATVGQTFSRGDILGYMGRSGYSTGSHLHFTVYDGKTFAMRSSRSCGLMPSGGDLNPLSYL